MAARSVVAREASEGHSAPDGCKHIKAYKKLENILAISVYIFTVFQ